MTQRLRVFLAIALVAAGCATGPVMPPAVAPQGDDRYLVDPRLGFTGASTPETEQRMETAWRYFLARNYDQARKSLAELRMRAPDYAPAALLSAAIDLRQGRNDTARGAINLIADQYGDYTAARIYQAEVALAEGNTRRAWEIYRSLSSAPGAPETVRERLLMAERRLFEELFTAAQTAEDSASIPLLREALTINPGAVEARLLLVQRLIGRSQFDEARRIVQPLVNSADAEREDVQVALAEIEAGRGRFEDAIVRYERLARQNPRFAPRLEEIKEKWTLANTPPQFRSALESQAITRSDFAVLMYWKLSAVRFAQNLPSPPIAIDLADVPGRDEIVRAIALGIYDVDPVTRRVAPFRPITTVALSRHTARLLTVLGAPCARVTPSDRIWEACGLVDPMMAAAPDAPVSGRQAARMIEQIETILQR